MQEKTQLKIDWATHEAAKFACENWHYSKSMPVNKTVKIGAWENDIFIGVVIFSPGASANLYKSYFIKHDEGCELTRVALNKHKTPVSRILSLAIKFLKNHCPNLKLIISFADISKGHHGGIYQATNWIYNGVSAVKNIEFFINGKWTHNKSAQVKYGLQKLSEMKKDQNIKKRITSPKHRYLFPLTEEMRLQLIKLKKPYPKRASRIESSTSGFQSEGGGESPTDALQLLEGEP